MRANQLEKTSSPTSARKRPFTLAQFSCSAFDIVLVSIRFDGFHELGFHGRAETNSPNAPKLARNFTRLSRIVICREALCAGGSINTVSRDAAL